MPDAAWFFRPGTEDRVEVYRFQDGRQFGIHCCQCEKNFMIGPEHQPSVGPDGALTTGFSMVCPVCKVWHVRFSGGVVEVFDA